jgi:peroxiredoxin
VGNDAPDFTLARHTGDEKVKLSDLDDRVVVLDFWATWCPPCVEGLPEIQAVHDWANKQDKPVDVFAVNLREKPGQVTDFLKRHDLDLPVLMDQDGSAAEAYGVEAIPTTVVIAHGKVANVHVGLAPNLESTLKSEINTALEKQ